MFPTGIDCKAKKNTHVSRGNADNLYILEVKEKSMNMFHIQMLNFLFFFLAHFQMFSPATAGQGGSIAISPAPFTRAQEAEAALDAIDPDAQDLICDSTCHKGKETYSNVSIL